MFTPDPAPAMITDTIATLNARRAARMMLGDFALDLVPPMRLVVFGHGEDFTGFARLAHMWGRWCRRVTHGE
jgi:hypothetical protein